MVPHADLEQSQEVTSVKLLREFIARRRNELQLSQQELARLSGVPAGTIASIEAGRVTRSPRPDTLQRLAQGLQVKAVSLLHLSGYLPAEADTRVDSLDLTGLDTAARERLLSLYHELRRSAPA